MRIQETEAKIKQTLANISEARRIVTDLFSSGTEAQITELSDTHIILFWNDGTYDIKVIMHNMKDASQS